MSSRKAFALDFDCCLYIAQLRFCFADHCLLIAADIPHWSTRLCRPDVLSILIAVYIQLRYAFALLITVDIEVRQICFCFADRGCYRPSRNGCVIQKCFRISIDAGDIQLRQKCFCFADCG